MTKEHVSRVQSSLLGVAIGDAMGMPWEVFTREEIMKETGGKGVLGFQESSSRRLKETKGLKLGDTTDDWQLTKVIAESLIRCNGYNLTDIASAHIRAYEECDFGWGDTTRRAMEDMKKYFDSRGSSGRAPWIPAISQKRGGCGNGVAMKIMPLFLWEGLLIYHDSILGSEFLERIKELGFMTHPDPRAWIVATAFIKLTLPIKKIESNDRRYINALLNEIVYETRFLEKLYNLSNDDKPSECFARILDENLLDDPVALRQRIKSGFFALESVPFSVATFLRHPTDFRAGVLEAINAGGDTDTNASMVGALIGSNCGLDIIPDEWKNFRPEYKEALHLGELLYKGALEL